MGDHLNDKRDSLGPALFLFYHSVSDSRLHPTRYQFPHDRIFSSKNLRNFAQGPGTNVVKKKGFTIDKRTHFFFSLQGRSDLIEHKTVKMFANLKNACYFIMLVY